jgi:hypothetical protein
MTLSICSSLVLNISKKSHIFGSNLDQIHLLIFKTRGNTILHYANFINSFSCRDISSYKSWSLSLLRLGNISLLQIFIRFSFDYMFKVRTLNLMCHVSSKTIGLMILWIFWLSGKFPFLYLLWCRFWLMHKRQEKVTMKSRFLFVKEW